MFIWFLEWISKIYSILALLSMYWRIPSLHQKTTFSVYFQTGLLIIWISDTVSDTPKYFFLSVIIDSIENSDFNIVFKFHRWSSLDFESTLLQSGSKWLRWGGVLMRFELTIDVLRLVSRSFIWHRSTHTRFVYNYQKMRWCSFSLLCLGLQTINLFDVTGVRKCC